MLKSGSITLHRRNNTRTDDIFLPKQSSNTIYEMSHCFPQNGNIKRFGSTPNCDSMNEVDFTGIVSPSSGNTGYLSNKYEDKIDMIVNHPLDNTLDLEDSWRSDGKCKLEAPVCGEYGTRNSFNSPWNNSDLHDIDEDEIDDIMNDILDYDKSITTADESIITIGDPVNVGDNQVRQSET